MIVAIRIAGRVGIKKDIGSTLDALHLRRKFNCVVIHEKPELIGMLNKVQAYVAYGSIDKETFSLLLKRAKPLQKNVPIKIEKNFADDFFSNKKSLADAKAKPFFCLHPPLGGIKKSTKKMMPQGILGNHKEKINELLKRMI